MVAFLKRAACRTSRSNSELVREALEALGSTQRYDQNGAAQRNYGWLNWILGQGRSAVLRTHW